MLKKDDDFFSLCKTIGNNLDKSKLLAEDVLHHSELTVSFKTQKKERKKHIKINDHPLIKSEEEYKTPGPIFKTPAVVQGTLTEEKSLDVILIDDDDDKPDNQGTTKEMDKLKQKHAKQKENLEIMHHHLTQKVVSGKRIPVLNLEEDIVFQDDLRVDKIQKLNNWQSKTVITQKSVFQSELTPYRPVKGTKLEYISSREFLNLP